MSKGKMFEKELLNMTSNSSQIEHTRIRDGEANGESESENSNVNTIEESQLKRRRYHRHTPLQIQELEAFFKECPHPNDRQRIELSQRLGMELLQVKFWFQNKRTQMKTQHEQKEYNQLKIENEKLRTKNLRLKEALSNASCLYCGVPISGSRQEMDHISSVSTTHFGSINNGRPNEGNRSVVVRLAMSAMEELMRVAQLGEPLWLPDIDQTSIVLNEVEYLRAFSRVFRQKTNGFKFEATRESVVVPTSAVNVAEILMDVEQWANVFSGVVSRGVNLQVISSGLGGTYNEALQVINAEFQVPSLLVPTRESYFLRYCKRHVDGVWAVVDVSFDHLHMMPSVTCRRRPSGCLIKDITNGHSKVIWVEHVEVEDGGIASIYKPLITSGLAFGARRWVAILEGYCQRLVRIFSTGVPSGNANNFLAEYQDGRRSMLKLAERMVTRFCRGVNTSTVNTWTTLSGNGNENVKFMTRTNVNDPSMPFGVLLSIATSFWLPIPPKRVFDFLCDDNTRNVWDMLLNGGEVEEIAHFVSGKEEINRVTLYQVKGSNSSSSHEMLMLQESRSDPTASYIVYAPIDRVCANAVLGGEAPSNIPLLPSGFAILPDGPTGRGRGRGMTAQARHTGGSLLTVALQILTDSTPNANLSMGSVAVANKLMWSTVDKLKQALIPQS